MRLPLPRIALPALALAVMVSGCGGGGGPAVLSYATDWTHAGGNPGGLSQRVLIYNAGGTLAVPVQIVDQTINGVQVTTITGLTSGDYRLHVDLFAGKDLTGAQTGVLDADLNFTGSMTFRSDVGVAATKVKVVPASATVPVPQNLQFYDGGTDAAGNAAFLTPNSTTWSVQPSTIGTIQATGTSAGLFTATKAGTGTITATFGALQGTAAVTTTANTATKTKWTVMVYMNAANDLDPYSVENFNQMESVASNPQVRFVVQWKQWQAGFPNSTFDGTRRYLVKYDTSNQIVSQLIQDMGTGIDMGNPQTLDDFITWSEQNYPADRYCLVIWDHGNGWRRSLTPHQATRGVSYDDQFGTSINVWQLQQALGNSQLDIVAWDASLMQMIEVADEIKSKTPYVVGSEESPPAAGYPYDVVFGKFRDNPDDTTADLCKSFVDGMIQAYGNSSQYAITQSVIDTSKIPALNATIGKLAGTLELNVGSLQTVVPAVRSASQSYSLDTVNGRYYYDLYDVCSKLGPDSNITAVQSACTSVMNAIKNAVIYENHNSGSPGSHGVSIDFSPSSSFNAYASDYGLLQFESDTGWGTWLAMAP